VTAPPDKAPLTLGELLRAREARAHRQAAWRERHGAPLVSITLVSPGRIKDSQAWRDVMCKALDVVDTTLAQHALPVLARSVFWARTGAEALYAVHGDPLCVKRAMVELEDSHPLGRLWDLDVIDERGPLSRRASGMRPRRCFVCDRDAHACARARRHPLPDLLAVIERIIDEAE
jgi:holo-ACP synthase